MDKEPNNVLTSFNDSSMPYKYYKEKLSTLNYNIELLKSKDIRTEEEDKLLNLYEEESKELSFYTWKLSNKLSDLNYLVNDIKFYYNYLKIHPYFVECLNLTSFSPYKNKALYYTSQKKNTIYQKRITKDLYNKLKKYKKNNILESFTGDEEYKYISDLINNPKNEFIKKIIEELDNEYIDIGNNVQNIELYNELKEGNEATKESVLNSNEKYFDYINELESMKNKVNKINDSKLKEKSKEEIDKLIDSCRRIINLSREVKYLGNIIDFDSFKIINSSPLYYNALALRAKQNNILDLLINEADKRYQKINETIYKTNKKVDKNYVEQKIKEYSSSYSKFKNKYPGLFYQLSEYIKFIAPKDKEVIDEVEEKEIKSK